MFDYRNSFWNILPSLSQGSEQTDTQMRSPAGEGLMSFILPGKKCYVLEK